MTRSNIMPVPVFDNIPMTLDGIFRDPFFGRMPMPRLEISPSVPRMAIDLQETDEGYVIEADLPGASKEDVSISLEDDVLTISYEKTDADKEEKDGYVVRERKSHVSIKRAVALPGADEENTSATMDAGVLKIEVGKAKPAESKKSIEIG